MECAEKSEETTENRLTEILCFAVRHCEFYCRLELLRLPDSQLFHERLGYVRLFGAVCELDFQFTLRLSCCFTFLACADAAAQAGSLLRHQQLFHSTNVSTFFRHSFLLKISFVLFCRGLFYHDY